jgi:hypothetical protein
MKSIYIFIAISSLFIASSIVYFTLTIISVVNMRDFEDCNDETCFNEGCIMKSCVKGTCVKSPIDGCCPNGNCEDISDNLSANYTFTKIYTGEITYPVGSNDTTIDINNQIYINNGSISDACLVSTGECINEIYSAQIETVNTDNINIYDNNTIEYITVGNDYLRIYSDGSLEFLEGSVSFNQTNSTNEVCLVEIQSLIENGTININNLNFSQVGELIINHLDVNGGIIIKNITNTLNINNNNTVTISISNITIFNNTVQSNQAEINYTLLINPKGGNVGIAIGSTDINTASLVYQLDVDGIIQADGLILSSSNESTHPIPYYEQTYITTYFLGPWTLNSPDQNIYLTRIDNEVQLSLNASYVEDCNGTQTYIESFDAIPERFIDSSNEIETQITVVDLSQEVSGRLIIDTNGYMRLETFGLNGYFEASSGNCGFKSLNAFWML